jgi:hypothetical protein
MRIFLTSSRWYFGIPGITIMTKKRHIVIWPDWIWSLKHEKYGFIQVKTY